jgi:ABC-type branched-subunit amino acid transport system substrate-binding protein
MPSLLLDPQSSSYADTFARLTTLAPDAVVLMTSPALAARFLQEWAVRGRPVRIYLGPTLKDPALLRNVPAGILEGLIGVSADLGEQASAFVEYFESRTAALPVAGAHYYFDAAALLALALAEGIARDGSLPTPAALKAHMLSVTSEGGFDVSFDSLRDAFALLSAGQKVTYRGAAGSYMLSSLGDSTLNRGSIWQVVGNDFVTVGAEQCDRTDIDKNFDPL